jgi:hypothetical protein
MSDNKCMSDNNFNINPDSELNAELVFVSPQTNSTEITILDDGWYNASLCEDWLLREAFQQQGW